MPQEAGIAKTHYTPSRMANEMCMIAERERGVRRSFMIWFAAQYVDEAYYSGYMGRAEYGFWVKTILRLHSVEEIINPPA